MTGQPQAARVSDDAGMVTVEAAIALSALVVVAVLAVFGIAGIGMHLSSIDAAREAARIAAQGDSARALSVSRAVAPRGAAITIGHDGELITARVRATVPVIAIDIGSTAVAAREPSADDE